MTSDLNDSAGVAPEDQPAQTVPATEPVPPLEHAETPHFPPTPSQPPNHSEPPREAVRSAAVAASHEDETHAPRLQSVFHIEVEKIKPNPDQPRRVFDEEGIKELAASIREFGLLQPIVVTKVEREVPNGTEVEYILISGERRLMAAKLLGLERIPAIVRNIDLERERLELAIIENIQRENLNPIEVARSFSRLQDEFRLTQREIASRLGKSREAVANAVRLLDLPQSIQEAIVAGSVSESHGRLLLSVADPASQEKLFKDLLANHFTTRELKRRVDASKMKPEERAREELPPELKMIREALSADLGAPVAIEKSGEAGGKITITFYSEEELQNIVDKVRGERNGI